MTGAEDLLSSWIVLRVFIENIEWMFAMNQKYTFLRRVSDILHFRRQCEKSTLRNRHVRRVPSFYGHAPCYNNDFARKCVPMQGNGVIRWKFPIEIIISFRRVSIGRGGHGSGRQRLLRVPFQSIDILDDHAVIHDLTETEGMTEY